MCDNWKISFLVQTSTRRSCALKGNDCLDQVKTTSQDTRMDATSTAKGFGIALQDNWAQQYTMYNAYVYGRCFDDP